MDPKKNKKKESVLKNHAIKSIEKWRTIKNIKDWQEDKIYYFIMLIFITTSSNIDSSVMAKHGFCNCTEIPFSS